MSASPKAIKQFIAVVELHFPRPKFNGEEAREAAWMASMTRVLIAYPDDVLADAAVRILSKYRGSFFPKPADCTDACDEALEVKRLREAPPMLSTGRSDKSQFAGWRVTLADDLLKTVAGVQAAREGWALAFHDFCRVNGRAPNAQESAQCRATTKGFDEDLDSCRRGEVGPTSSALTKLGEKMRARRDELAKSVA